MVYNLWRLTSGLTTKRIYIMFELMVDNAKISGTDKYSVDGMDYMVSI